jgi:hypothetical protein
MGMNLSALDRKAYQGSIVELTVPLGPNPLRRVALAAAAAYGSQRAAETFAEAWTTRMERFLCISNSLRGVDFLHQCAEMDVRPTVLTLEGLRDASWPREAIEDLAIMPAGLTREQMLNTIAWMARGRSFHRVFALDAANLLCAAEVREYMRVPGMGVTTAGFHCDRLAMRLGARASGFAGPEFCRVLNYDEMRAFMTRTPAPWLLMPRTPGPGLSPIAAEDSEQLWRALDVLGDQQSHYLLEQPLTGEHFTVESIVFRRQVILAQVLWHRPLAGGATETETVDRSGREWAELMAWNKVLAPSFGMVQGVVQTHFVRIATTGEFRFAEIVAGVSADSAVQVVEAATGLNLWREWARLEVAHLRGVAYAPNGWTEHDALYLEYPAGRVAADTPELAARELLSRVQAGGYEQLLFRATRRERMERLSTGLVKALEDASTSTCEQPRIG